MKNRIPKITRSWVIFALAVVIVAALSPTWVEASDQTIYITAQRYDHGVMYYRSDTGMIWLLADTGRAYHFPSGVYGALPDNPIFNIPAGRVRPINGFGRIWGNHAWVREQFGWPVRAEFGYTGRIITYGSSVYLVEFDGQVIHIEGSYWSYDSSLPVPPPVLTPNIDRLSASPDPVTAGSALTVTWNVYGTDFALIEIYDSAGNQIAYYDRVGLASNATLVVPFEERDHLRVVAWGANYGGGYTPAVWIKRVVSAEIIVHVQAPDTQVDHTDYTQAAFQQYANGFMIWRADTGAVLAFVGGSGGNVYTFPESSYGSLPDNTLNPPAGYVKPVSGFGKVWGNHAWLQNQLGWATGPEQPYDMTVKTFGSARTQTFLLPDGRNAEITQGHTWVIR